MSLWARGQDEFWWEGKEVGLRVGVGEGGGFGGRREVDFMGGGGGGREVEFMWSEWGAFDSEKEKAGGFHV